MFALRPYHRGVREAVWMAAMAVLAAAIMFLMNVKLAGAAAPVPPRFIPDFVAEWQEAVNLFRDGNFSEAHGRMQDMRYRVAPGIPNELPVDRGLAVWNALTAQADGKLEQAMSQWARIELPAETRVWKHVAIASMNLERGRNEEASEELATAQLLDPDNALVLYFLGVLHLQQSDEAIDWPDNVVKANIRLVAPPQGRTEHQRNVPAGGHGGPRTCDRSRRLY